jgi:hypothetical protein
MSKRKLTAEQMHELTISEFRKLSKADQERYLKSDLYQRMIQEAIQHSEQAKSNRKQFRSELSPDDSSELRWLSELRDETGLNWDRLQDGFTVQSLEEITQMMIRKRKASLPHDWQEKTAEQWAEILGRTDRQVRNWNANEEPWIKQDRYGWYSIDLKHSFIIELIEEKNSRK